LLGVKAILETNSREVEGESEKETPLLCNFWLGVWVEFKDEENEVNNEEFGEEQKPKEFKENLIKSAIQHKIVQSKKVSSLYIYKDKIKYNPSYINGNSAIWKTESIELKR